MSDPPAISFVPPTPPRIIVEAPAACWLCGAPSTRWNNDGEARFACGSTTTGLRHGIEICKSPEKPRAIALYRQHLKRKGLTDAML